MTRQPSFLLLQVRNPDDPMREHEIQCFSRSFRCDRDQIRVFDLLGGVPSRRTLADADVVLLGDPQREAFVFGQPLASRGARNHASAIRNVQADVRFLLGISGHGQSHGR